MRVMQAHKKCATKIKERNKEIFNGRKEFILVLHKTIVMHLDELRETVLDTMMVLYVFI